MNFRCRFQKIIIDNLKNVGHGEINFPCSLINEPFVDNSDILGLYGQNGSGKTTLIFALSLFRNLMTGSGCRKDLDNYIKVGNESAKLYYEISLESETYGNYMLYYSVTFSKKKKENYSISTNEMEEDDGIKESRVYVSEEKLQYKRMDGKKGNKTSSIIEYNYLNETSVFKPDVRYKDFIKEDKELSNDLKYIRNYSYKSGSSFIFSIGIIKDVRYRNGFSEELIMIMDSIQSFGLSKLYIMSNVQTSIINANIILPMTFRFEDGEKMYHKVITFDIRLTGESKAPSFIYDLIEKRFMIINKVVEKIIPGLSIIVEKRGIKLDPNGEELTIFELVSIRGEDKVLLRYESDGIKKLVYVLYSLILMYNDPSVTVAIDELDSGVFEYLLGEVLTVLQEHAKGQLVFTSHNLRALEVLDKKSVMFSTTNPNNRYIHFKYIKGTNNLRNVYYQNILLGGQDECVYEPTSQSSIRRAFRSAGGDING